MLSQLQKQLIVEANQKYNGKILPIGGKPQHDKRSFTGYKHPSGIRYSWFWFEDWSKSTHVVRKQISCPQCGGLLQFNADNLHGHCTQCERRGQ